MANTTKSENDKIAEQYTNEGYYDINERLKHFKSSFDRINKTLDQYHNYQPWLVLKVRNEYENKVVDALTIDTYTSIATVALPNGKKATVSNIMLIDFQYDKNGSGKANSFSITFAFNPNDKQDAAGEPLDPMIIDKALVTSSYFLKEGDSYRAIDTIGKHKCYIRYGYNLGTGESLMSPRYFGQAIQAKSELRDGLIYYTITGYSSITYYTNKGTECIPQRGTPEKDDNGNVVDENGFTKCSYGWKACDAMWEAIMLFFGTREDGSDRRENNPDFDKLYPNTKVNIKNISDSEDEVEIYIEGGNKDESIFEYLERVRKNVHYKENDNTEDKSKNKTLEWTIIEEDDELTFLIYTSDPTDEKVESEDNGLYMTDVVYQYPTKSNSIVRSFTPNFDYSIIWSNDIFSGESIDSKSYFIDPNGNIKSYKTSTISEYSSGNEQDRTILDFAEAMRQQYSANMTTLGIPADIPIGAIIKVRPIINGFEYHYAGYYMVTKTTDRIDTNGYTTEYELFKLSSARTYDKTAQEIYNESKTAAEEQKRAEDKERATRYVTDENGNTYRETYYQMDENGNVYYADHPGND